MSYRPDYPQHTHTHTSARMHTHAYTRTGTHTRTSSLSAIHPPAPQRHRLTGTLTYCCLHLLLVCLGNAISPRKRHTHAHARKHTRGGEEVGPAFMQIQHNDTEECPGCSNGLQILWAAYIRTIERRLVGWASYINTTKVFNDCLPASLNTLRIYQTNHVPEFSVF